MKCPIDDVDLQMTERQGMEIDYCPKCRGVWLDRGELDKILERSAASETPARPAEKPGFQERPRYQEQRHHDDRHENRPKKKESFFENLFDF